LKKKRRKLQLAQSRPYDISWECLYRPVIKKLFSDVCGKRSQQTLASSTLMLHEPSSSPFQFLNLYLRGSVLHESVAEEASTEDLTLIYKRTAEIEERWYDLDGPFGSLLVVSCQ